MHFLFYHVTQVEDKVYVKEIPQYAVTVVFSGLCSDRVDAELSFQEIQNREKILGDAKEEISSQFPDEEDKGMLCEDSFEGK